MAPRSGFLCLSVGLSLSASLIFSQIRTHTYTRTHTHELFYIFQAGTEGKQSDQRTQSLLESVCLIFKPYEQESHNRIKLILGIKDILQSKRHLTRQWELLPRGPQQNCETSFGLASYLSLGGPPHYL